MNGEHALARHVPAGPHGGDRFRVASQLGVPAESLLDLSASFNPVAPDITVLARRHAAALRWYPDPAVARQACAEAMGIEPSCLLLTNGGAEAIALVAGLMGGRVHEPEFGLHPRGGPGQPLWRSNPHNPSGRLASMATRADVWDEAFYQLATGRWTRGDTGARAVVGSFTKVFACPGLRLGYVLGPPELIVHLEEAQPTWSVGSLGLAMLPELLASADLEAWAASVAQLRREMHELLDSFNLAPQPSDANFVLCAVPPGFRDALLGQGVIVRDCASFGMPSHVRVAVPDSDGLARLHQALVRAIG